MILAHLRGEIIVIVGCPTCYTGAGSKIIKQARLTSEPPLQTLILIKDILLWASQQELRWRGTLKTVNIPKRTRIKVSQR